MVASRALDPCTRIIEDMIGRWVRLSARVSEMAFVTSADSCSHGAFDC